MALLYVALAFVIGLAVAGSMDSALFGCGWAGWLWLIPAALLPMTPLLNRLERRPEPVVWPASAGFVAPRRFPSFALVGAVTLALAAGFLHMAATPLTPCWTDADLAWHNIPAANTYDSGAPWVTVTGFVDAYVAQTDQRSRIYVRATTIDAGSTARAGDQPVRGRVTLLADPDLHLQYGAPLRLRGVLSTPPDFRDFSYREHLARRGVHSQMALAQVQPLEGAAQGNSLLRALYALRSRGEQQISRALAEPYASLANGMLLGIESNIPDAVREQFNDTSASHVIVMSGSNIALITGVLLAASAWLLGKRRAWLVTLAGVAFYTLLVGAEPTIVRAALMGALVVIAAALGRQSTALVSLAVACLIMTAFAPHVLWDVGFQMSAAATAGLVLVAPRFSHAFAAALPRANRAHLPAYGAAKNRHTILQLLGDSLAVTLGASLAVLPIILYAFHRLSLVGILTNVLIVPVQPLILFAGSAGLLAGLIGLWPLAQLLFWGAWLGLAWTVAIVDATARVRWASVAVGGYGLGALLASYATLAAFVWLTHRRAHALAPPAPHRAGRADALLRSPLTLGALAALCALVWLAVRALPDGRLHVYLLPVNKGMAALIKTPSGAQVLVDGGGEPATLLTALGGVMGFWDRSLDLALLSLADKDAAATQAALPARITVAAALGPPATGTTGDAGGASAAAAVDGWVRTWEAATVPVARAAAGGWVELGDGVALWAEAAPPTGSTQPRGKVQPLAWRLVYGNFSLLLPGNAAPFGQPANVLLLRTAAHAEEGWPATARPDLMVVYGAASLKAADTIGTDRALLSPLTDGVVEIWSDGSRWGWGAE